MHITCGKCGALKARGDFPAHKLTCKSCIAEYQKVYRAANATKRTEYQQRYYQDNKEGLDARNVAWAKANPDKNRAIGRAATGVYRGRHPEKVKAAERQYHSANPHIHTAKEARRRARKNRANPVWSDVPAILAIYAEAAALERLVGGVEVDHIVPLRSVYVCGLHVHQNLQVLDERENHRKSNKHWPDMWPVTDELRQLVKSFQKAKS